MKRFTMILALALMIAMPMMAERVKPETARKVATTFLSNNGAKATQLTNLSKEAGFTNLYIFNAEQGFVVMAADDCVQPILGYSLTNTFVAEGMPENIKWWLQGYNDQIQDAINDQMKASAETNQLWKELIAGKPNAAKATAVVNALVQTTWDQNGFYYYSGGQWHIFELYNNLCPYDNNAGERTVTGCAATAMAQIMKYWNYPAQGIGSHSYTPSTRPDLGVQSANFGETTYEWANMPNQLSQTSTTTQINAIATLMYHCGVSVDMMYDISSNGGSGAYSNDIPYALINYFNYKSTATYLTKSSYTDSNWIALLKSELNAGRPIEYNGSGSGGGHAFVCDGYDSSNNFHFNWGWSGQNDGFFALTSLNPGSGGSGGGSYDFTNNQNAVIGIEPASTLAAPTNLTYTLSGTQNVTLSWVGVSGALSYNVFRNGNLIGNATSTTYSDTTPYGTTSYYVRGVDSNNQMSLPSNTVTVTIDYPTPIVNDLTGSLSENNISLSWTAPEWCYPETPSATLTYGDGTPSGYSLGYNNPEYHLYWGHCYPSSSLTPYSNMSVYMVSFYANATGSYKVYIYKGTSAGHPETQVFEQSFSASSSGWVDVSLTDKYLFDASKDLWIFIYDPEGRGYPAAYSYYSGDNGNFYSLDPTSWIYTTSGAAFLIRTYLTDGTYTYNLYQDGNAIAQNISQTSYNATLNNNAANLFTVKTNYYDGETAASNAIGFAKGTASIASLEMATNDQMTITENSTLTVNGTLSDANATNLILENGAQLINSSTGVQATVRMDISGYTGNGGWYTISSPFVNLTPSIDNGLINGNYDLYAYDEDGDAEGNEWINYKAGNFSMVPSLGYLYANDATQSLDLSGELNSGVYSQTVNLSYNNTLEGIKGFNLLGNPTAHAISFTKSSDVADGYYYVDNGETWTYTTGNSVPVGRGFLVKANASGQSVTLNPQSKDNNSDSGQYLCLSIGEDNAYIKLNEGISMPLMDLNGNHSSLYLLSDCKPYVMLVRNDAEVLDLCFESKHNGTQTITVDANGLDLNYLHLIDNLTGNDVDLLATPSYTFEAKTTNYASRFKLVFAANAMGANDSFVYVADGHLSVLNQGEALLQIIDVTGRILCTETIQGNCRKALDLSEGVYVVRLTQGIEVKTQKVVVR